MSTSSVFTYKRARPSVYTSAAGTLLVATADMWRVHEASKPAAVAERAGLSLEVWYSWKNHQGVSTAWLTEWLYGEDAPADAGGFRPTPAMRAFRGKARITSPGGILASALRPEGAAVPGGLLRKWLKHYGKLAWFWRWLLRGEDPPAGVQIATEGQAARMRAWCDYARHCKTAGVKVGDTFTEWLRGGKIPDVGWLLWLFGWPEPAGAFVVSAKLQKLRQERTPTAICAPEAADIDYSTYRKAKRKPRVQEALAQALEIAGAAGHPSRAGVGSDLPAETMRWVWSYADAATLKACCKRANLLPSTYHEALRQADTLGVAADLRDYLENGPRWQGAGARLTGLVAANLFIPSEYMLAFREAACREMAEQNITALAREVPLFREWFLDWAVTQVHKGRRITLPGHRPAEREDLTCDAPAGTPAEPEQLLDSLPRIASAQDIARLLSLPESTVVPELQRCYQRDTTCRTPVDSPRKGQARYVYYTDRVRPALRAMLARHVTRNGR
jgi:hypothetical protein